MRSNFNRLIVLDSNPPWIRCFLEAMPPAVSIRGLRVYNALSFPGGIRGLVGKTATTESIQANWQDTWQAIPGWHKAFAISSWLVMRRLKRLIERFGKPDALVFTLPWYAKVAEGLPGFTKVYYAHDPFRFYDWDSQKVIALEARLLNSCDFGLAVAKKIIGDLRQASERPVHYFPNATGWAPGVGNPIPIPEDLATIPQPRIGCVGQISEAAYDCDLIARLSSEFVDAHYVFIGPLFEGTRKNQIIAELFKRPNIHWLGPKNHEEIPAYLRHFDVCVNLLKIGEHNDRRSPLRLFDYLTTDRPVLSTGVAEAFHHRPHVAVASDHNNFLEMLREILSHSAPVNTAGRTDYLQSHTWDARVEQFKKLLMHSID